MINQKQIKLLVRLVAWLAVIVIGILSLLPGDERPHTGAPGDLEHIAAYLGTAALLALGYGEGRQPLVVVVCLSFYSAALEFAQTQIPGRHPAFFDFIASSAGAIVGAALAWVGLKALQRIVR